MHHILKQDVPSDYIIATNSSISVREICKLVGEILEIKDIFNHINLPEGVKDTVEHQKNYYQGDNTKLLSIGWKPQYKVRDTINEILAYDMKHS
jgi:nucleoside-diphosphate-sugar epimerase